MNNLDLKKIIIAIISLIGAFLLLISQSGLYSHNNSAQGQNIGAANYPSASSSPSNTSSTNEINLVSMTPANLDQSVILPTQPIVLTFNQPIDNGPDFKHRFDPVTPEDVTLSGDHKTITITPKPSFNLGTGYTLFIEADAKFQGGKTLDKDLIFHFKTIDYNGV